MEVRNIKKMKILLVASQMPDTIMGSIGIYCRNALKKLGYELQVFDYRQSQYLKSSAGRILRKFIKKIIPEPSQQIPFVNRLEKNRMNQSLVDIVKSYHPDVLLVLMGENILPETLKEIKQFGTITVNWFHDSVLASIRKDFVQDISPYYDYFFIIDSEEVLNYVKISSGYVKSLPLGCAPEIHRTINLTEVEKKKYGSDICFVGTVKYKRADVLKYLKDFDLAIWGYWLEKIPELKKFYRCQYVFGDEAVKIYNASKIALDIHLSYGTEDKRFNVTPRVFEVPATGAFLMVDENPCLKDLYKVGEEIICYSDMDDLKEKIKYFLSHPDERKKIAQKGQQRAYREHTYEKRLKEIFSIIYT